MGIIYSNDNIIFLSISGQGIYTAQTYMGTIINLDICDETYHTFLTRPKIMIQDGLPLR
jgi:hypothetical protein